MKKLLLAMMLIGVAYTATAASNGNDLYEWGMAFERVNGLGSRDPADTMKAGLFMGYVTSAADFTKVLGTTCSPEDVINGQNFDIVFNYLKSHPEKRTDTAALVMVNAMKEAYPCKN